MLSVEKSGNCGEGRINLRDVVLAGLLLICFLLIPFPLTAKPHGNPQKVTLEIASVLQEAGPLLAFTVTNESRGDLDIVEPGISPSAIVFVTPDGKVVEPTTIADFEPGTRPRIRPGETKTWKINAWRLFNAYEFNTPGTYRIFWKYAHSGVDKKITIYKSNEALVLREKTTPVIDPKTGYLIRPQQ